MLYATDECLASDLLSKTQSVLAVFARPAYVMILPHLSRSLLSDLIASGKFRLTAPFLSQCGSRLQNGSSSYFTQMLWLRPWLTSSSITLFSSVSNVDTGSLASQSTSRSKSEIDGASERGRKISGSDKIEVKTKSSSVSTSPSDANESVSTDPKLMTKNSTFSPRLSSTEAPPKIPDVPSTSLGLFEEADEKDPNKWKKFAWKYGGAVLLFMISYKTLHWYVDRLEADGKRRREEMEENKNIANEIREKGSEFPSLSSSVSIGASDTDENVPLSPMSKSPSASALPPGSTQLQTQTPQEFFDQLSAQVLTSSSELDELYTLKGELEKKRKDISNRQVAGDNCSDELSNLDIELEALHDEIKYLEGRKHKGS